MSKLATSISLFSVGRKGAGTYGSHPIRQNKTCSHQDRTNHIAIKKNIGKL